MALTPEHRTKIGQSLHKHYQDPTAREAQSRIQKAKWDPNTPEGRRLRAQAREKSRLAQAKAQRDAIDAAIAQKILDGLLAPTDPAQLNTILATAEGGGLDA